VYGTPYPLSVHPPPGASAGVADPESCAGLSRGPPGATIPLLMGVDLVTKPQSTHDDVGAPDRLYTPRFFQVFVGVVLMMTCTALQFHFGQYVGSLGHSVDVLGRILGFSFAGTFAIRLSIGGWIDRTGCRRVWIAGSIIVAASVGAIQFVESLWLITVLRALAQMATASVLTTVAVFAANIAPAERRAESIGSMGLAGFCGMIIGPALGDWIFAKPSQEGWEFHVFFTASAVAALLACAVIWSMPEDIVESEGDPRGTPGFATTGPQLRIIYNHWPGTIVLVGVVFMAAWCLQSLFLERLAEARGFRDIKVFFLVYAPTAILLRLLFRRVPQQIGRTRTVVGGLALLVVGLLLLVGVERQSQLVIPAMIMGAGHCFIFPSMVDLCAGRLPHEYRGTGTALIFAAGDLGLLIGYVCLGALIESRGFDAAIVVLAVAVGAAMMIFAVARRRAILTPRVEPKRSLSVKVPR